MLEFDFDESIAYWLCHTAHVFQRALTKELAPFGVTAQYFQVLMWLSAEGELFQTELAERLQLDNATVAGILLRMERDGWIYRQESLEDRRKKIVRTMPRAFELREKLVDCVRRLNERAVEGIDENELQLFCTILHMIRLNVQRCDKPV